ncbi:hypothetical protein H9Q69_013055 [Fusarium xylarioides]|nr:hypothetical protein H9Q69_013055 [Fusarium xylarioides]
MTATFGAKSADRRRLPVHEHAPNLSLGDEGHQKIDIQDVSNGVERISASVIERAREGTASDESNLSRRREDVASSREPSKMAKPIGDSICHVLLDQSVADFVYESYCQVQRLSLTGIATEQDRALMNAFRRLGEGMEAVDNDRYVGSLRTAALSVKFAQWHQCQVKWLESTTKMSTQSATKSVYERSLGPRPQQPGARQDEWKRRRQRSSTSCTRGKKWLKLLGRFGEGILFKVLLEINEQDEKVYHYDSMSNGETPDVKAACEKAFSFRYVEQEVMQQPDGHSCGPLVIKNARDRMMGRPVGAGTLHSDDTDELRMEALRILKLAWNDHALVVAPKEEGIKKRKRKPNSSGTAEGRKWLKARSRQRVLIDLINE